MNNFAIKKAYIALQHGGIIAYPTEAVYGLGCDPLNQDALKRLLKLKHRSPSKGLILVASDFAQLEPFLKPVTPEIFNRVMKSWPGPTTWLLPANEQAPKILRGKYTMQAVRISAHPLVEKLCNYYGSAIVSTSANLSGRPAARNALTVRKIFNGQIDFVISNSIGELKNPSEIKNAITGETIRPQ